MANLQDENSIISKREINESSWCEVDQGLGLNVQRSNQEQPAVEYFVFQNPWNKVIIFSKRPYQAQQASTTSRGDSKNCEQCDTRHRRSTLPCCNVSQYTSTTFNAKIGNNLQQKISSLVLQDTWNEAIIFRRGSTRLVLVVDNIISFVQMPHLWHNMKLRLSQKPET